MGGEKLTGTASLLAPGPFLVTSLLLASILFWAGTLFWAGSFLLFLSQRRAVLRFLGTEALLLAFLCGRFTRSSRTF